eukprot:g21437.t1
MGIAVASGLPVAAGLITGIVGGLIVGAFAGSPLQVSGPAAGLTVIVYGIVQEHGIGALGIAVLICGLVQVAAGLLRFGQWFRAVSPAVVQGMLSGIGILILASQFHVMFDGSPKGSGLENLAAIGTTVASASPETAWAASIGMLSIVSMCLWQCLASRRLRLVPSALIAVIVGTATAAALGLPIFRIEISGDLLSTLRFSTLSAWQDAPWAELIPAGIAMAVVASAETLLCAIAVDRMHQGPRTSYNRELSAQGIGNVICGLLGALPMTGVIVRSATNVSAGAKTRASAVLHGVWLLVFTAMFARFLHWVPTACLAGVLVYTGYKLANLRAVSALWRHEKSEALIYLATVTTVVAIDLLTGVVVGIALSAAKLLLRFSYLKTDYRADAEENRVLLSLTGAATFLRLPQLARELDRVPRDAELHIDVTSLSHIDHACLDLIQSWTKQHKAAGGRLLLDWENSCAPFFENSPMNESLSRMVGVVRRNSRLWISTGIAVLLVATAILSSDTWIPRLFNAAEKKEEDEKKAGGPSDSIHLSEQAKRNIGLRVGDVEVRKEHARKLSVPGMVVSLPGRTRFQIASPMTGIVTEIAVVRGQSIQSDELLFRVRLSHEDLVRAQTDFLRTLGELDAEQKEIARLEKVSGGGVAARLVLERQYARDKLAAVMRAQEEALHLHGLSETQITFIREKRRLVRELVVRVPRLHKDFSLHFDREFDPHKGASGSNPRFVKTSRKTMQDHSRRHRFVVEQLPVHVGQTVKTGDTLCVLADYQILYIEGWAFEQDADELVAAAQQKRSLSAISESKKSSRREIPDLRIIFVENEIDAKSRALRFYVGLRNQTISGTQSGDDRYLTWKYRPGQRVQLRATQMEIDVFPNLNRPRVVVITEAPGMAPEEVEALITFPLETALNGANGVMAVRSSSGVGISVVYVEFEWGTDIYNDRQIVNERLALVQERMPPGIKPTLAPISSIMGQIFMMGMWSQENQKTQIDTLDSKLGQQLDAGDIPRQLREAINRQPRKVNAGGLSGTATVFREKAVVRCVIFDKLNKRRSLVRTYPDRITVDYKDVDEKVRYFEINENISSLLRALDDGRVPDPIASGIAERSGSLPQTVTVEQRPVRWKIHDEENDRLYLVRRSPGKSKLELHKLTTDLELRTLADWVVRQRLLTIPGVSQVFTMGGGRKQFQVLVDPDALLRFGVTLHDVKAAVEKSNRNSTGGYLDDQGPNEFLVRALGRVQTIADLEKLAVSYREGRAILLKQVARVVEAAQVKRGDSTAFMKGDNGNFGGGPAVVLTINKQPGADTRGVTDNLVAALDELRPSLPPDVQMVPGIYSQREFIDRAVFNVEEALADGGVLVVVLLFLFLMNFRTTFITLTAIPLSLVITALIFKSAGISINTMTLGGIAVAIGELVDDAIVDVENIFRRLRLNREAGNPKHPLLVVFQASVEIRNSIVFGTMIVVIAFVPVFALEGMEGRLFAPLGLAYMVSILASLAVSLTLTPVLSYLLLTRNTLWRIIAPLMAFGISASVFYWVFPRFAEIFHQNWMKINAPKLGTSIEIPGGMSFDLTPKLFWTLAIGPIIWLLIRLTDHKLDSEEDGLFLRSLKWLAGGAIRSSLQVPVIMLLLAGAAIAIAGIRVSQLERDLLPPFNEGSVQLNVILPPGTSLRTSSQISSQVQERLKALDFVAGFVRRTGRAELDEHAEGVNMSEFIVNLNPNSEKSREEIIEEITETMADIPGIVTTVEQPLAHLISHMISGVKAQVAIKLYGDDLTVLRKNARAMEVEIRKVQGVTGLLVEPQVVIPQLRIQVDRDKLLQYGLTPDDINEYVQTALNGEVVSQVLLDQRTFDLLVRFDENYREDLPSLRRLAIEIPADETRTSPDENSTDQDREQQATRGRIPLEAVAKIYESGGPNTINRERVRRRIVVQCNVSGRGLVDVVQDIQKRLKPIQESLPAGYYVEYGGQFQAEKRASRRIAIMFAIAMIGVFMVLYTMFGSVNFSLQVMIALPMAFIGSVAALIITDQRLSVAAMVGFISLGGIASRNGILLLNHYLHLVKHEGETWSKEMIVHAGQDRLAPVLMTALTSGIGLLPLAMAAGEPGKEVLYPIATVIIGGLLSSTLLEFIVRPALFWTFGRKAGARLLEESRSEVALITEEQEAELRSSHSPSIAEEGTGGA